MFLDDLNKVVKLFSAIKKKMEKDIDEVGKIARVVKAKIEAINKDVLRWRATILLFDSSAMKIKGALNKYVIRYCSLYAESSQQTEAWLREGNWC